MTAAAPVLITGTGTDVGKTIATAALAALGRSTGLDAGICKPVQTGLRPGEPGDADEAARLSGARRVLEVRRLPDPLAPETAARVAGLPQSQLDDLVGPIRRWLGADSPPSPDSPAGSAVPRARLDLIEGAGGVLVRLGTDLTVLDLAAALAAPVLVVARAGLGTLSDTELTVRAIEDAGLRCAGIVIGSWPTEPTLAERCNLEDLPRLTGVPVLGRVPAGAGRLSPDEFAQRAPGWFIDDALAALQAPRPASEQVESARRIRQEDPMSTRIGPTTDQALAGVLAGHRMAGMNLSAAELEVLRRQADGELTGDQARDELLAALRRS